MVNVKPDGGHGYERWSDRRLAPRVCTLNRFQEGEGEGFQDREHVGDLLGHTEHAFCFQSCDKRAFCHGGKSSSMPVHFISWDAPAGGCSIEIDAQDNTLLFQDECFLGIVQRG